MWMDTLISTLKVVGKEDCPIAHTELALSTLFNSLVLLESDDVLAALAECETMEREQFDPIKCTDSPPWKKE
jgi:hypothetical protein